ncbi:putative septum site-determining protein [Actinacidiphila reveromycinica]|uniref:Putative septum site-determining protein n=1 Tax=Actinacidiphila reveromycinica TaxID=659352 RepID=A0A7U3VPX6_9ACTN|nr:septum site-determining protein Ssd [Streptomyces sp. SN-593]BBA99118.1 putative septum site-determining protein [Streptomyces sp. SN-593]
MARTNVSDRPCGVTEGVRGPLIVTEDESLLDDLLRLCAAAGAEPEVVFTAPPRAVSWEDAPLVLVGVEASGRVQGAPRRKGVLLVGRGGAESADSEAWRRAVAVGADHVLFLPAAEAWLVDRLADVAEGGGGPALTIGVVGGRGGAGASTLACGLAVTAARTGVRAMLVDGDPLGGGLDILLGAERTGGLRWPELADSRGRVNSGVLEESLPRLGSLSVLSWDRGRSTLIPPQAMRSVMGAARRGGGVVVVDLPRTVDDTVAETLGQVDVGLLVVPAELRAVASGCKVATVFAPELDDLRVVARGPFGTGLDGNEIARLIGLPLAGELRPEPALADPMSGGAPPGSAVRGPLARFSSAFLGQVLTATGCVTA